MNRGIDAYRRTSVETSSPLELVVMLYDGALRFAAEAREAIAAGDIRRRSAATSRVLAIVGQLRETLDVERGGSMATTLDELYGFVTTRVMDASFRREVGPLDEAVNVLSTLRGAWAELAATQGAQRP